MRKVSCIFKSKEMKAYWYRQCTDTEWDLRGYLLSYLHFADRDSVDRKTGDRRQLSCPCWWNSSDRHERVGSVWRHWTIVTLQVNTDWCWRNSLWLTRHTLYSSQWIIHVTAIMGKQQSKIAPEAWMGIYFAMTFKDPIMDMDLGLSQTLLK